jgi:hypothetical protein
MSLDHRLHQLEHLVSPPRTEGPLGLWLQASPEERVRLEQRFDYDYLVEMKGRIQARKAEGR